MALVGGSVNDTYTSIATTGGTDLTLSQVGGSSPTTLSCALGTGDYKTLRMIDFKIVLPRVNASSPSGWTQRRSEIVCKVPRELADGSITFDTFRMALACDVNTTDAEALTMRKVATELVSREAVFADFWDNQSLA